MSANTITVEKIIMLCGHIGDAYDELLDIVEDAANGEILPEEAAKKVKAVMATLTESIGNI